MAEPKHKKMYRGSPRIEADDDGKKVIKKGPTEKEKESAKVAAGTDKMPEHDVAVQKLHMKHAKERMELNQKHEREHLALSHKKTAVEGSPAEEANETPAEAEKEGD